MTDNPYIKLFDSKRDNLDEFALLYFQTLKANPQDTELIVEAFQPIVQTDLNITQIQETKVKAVESEYNLLIKKFNERGFKIALLKANATESKFKEHIVYWILAQEQNRKAANDWCKAGMPDLDSLFSKYMELVN